MYFIDMKMVHFLLVLFWSIGGSFFLWIASSLVFLCSLIVCLKLWLPIAWMFEILYLVFVSCFHYLSWKPRDQPLVFCYGVDILKSIKVPSLQKPNPNESNPNESNPNPSRPWPTSMASSPSPKRWWWLVGIWVWSWAWTACPSRRSCSLHVPSKRVFSCLSYHSCLLILVKTEGL